jgi:anti-anti-sigma factor
MVMAAHRRPIVKLCGELDTAMAPAVRARLTKVEGDVELDCAGLTFMDAAGLTLFLEVHQLCHRRGAKLTVVNPPRCVTRLLALSRLDSVLDVRCEDVGG